jgi:hypothetical protein
MLWYNRIEEAVEQVCKMIFFWSSIGGQTSFIIQHSPTSKQHIGQQMYPNITSMESHVADPECYGRDDYVIVWNEGTTYERFKTICREGLMPQKWPWVHCRAPYKENFGIQNLPPLKPGFYRIVIVIDGRKCNVMNSDRNVQHRYNYRLMQAGMQPLADHLKLCDNIDRFTAQTHCKNVFVNTMTKKMCAVARRVRPQGEDWTDTSFREHSEIHVGSVDPSQFLLAYYRPESIGQPIDKWNADNPLANNKKSK